jgi:hypothetical protein
VPFARSPGRSSCLPTVSCAHWQAAGAVRAAHTEVIMVSGVSRLYAHGDAQTQTAAGSPHLSLSTVRALIMLSPWRSRWRLAVLRLLPDSQQPLCLPSESSQSPESPESPWMRRPPCLSFGLLVLMQL